MASMLTSKLTERSQTTLPTGVRRVLDLEPGERIGYIIEGNAVRLVNASAEDAEDPVFGKFLELLERDMIDHPDRLKPFPKSLLKLARALTNDVDIDHVSGIDGATAL